MSNPAEGMAERLREARVAIISNALHEAVRKAETFTGSNFTGTTATFTITDLGGREIHVDTNIAGTPAKDDDMSTKNQLLTAYREGRDAVGRYAESENDEAWDLRVEAAGREANAAYALKQMAEDPVHMDLPIDPDVRINTDTKGHPHA